MHVKRPLLKVIRAKCIDCCCGDRTEVKHCPVTDCDLHPYRLGKNPFNAGREISQERRDAASVRIRAYHSRVKKAAETA
mgnify:FL=1|jgi:hypothetical protein